MRSDIVCTCLYLFLKASEVSGIQLKTHPAAGLGWVLRGRFLRFGVTASTHSSAHPRRATATATTAVAAAKANGHRRAEHQRRLSILTAAGVKRQHGSSWPHLRMNPRYFCHQAMSTLAVDRHDVVFG